MQKIHQNSLPFFVYKKGTSFGSILDIKWPPFFGMTHSKIGIVAISGLFF